VELVLLTADETSEEKKFLEEIGTALRQVLRNTAPLFHTGVSVLCAAGGSEPFKGRLRRAFPWLLNATREWLSSPDATHGKRGANPGRRLRRLTLNNYRLPGTREIVFSNAQVHLIHGPNGSGKSSIVGAVELVSRGKVGRRELALEKQYAGVTPTGAATAPATIAL